MGGASEADGEVSEQTSGQRVCPLACDLAGITAEEATMNQAQRALEAQIEMAENNLVVVKKTEMSEAAIALKLAMRKAVALGNHTYSIAQLVGVYPA
jgi:hypothetical protein